MLPAREREPEVIQHVFERPPGKRHGERIGVREVRQCLPSRRMQLAEDQLSFWAFGRAPMRNVPLQGAQQSIGKPARMQPLQLGQAASMGALLLTAGAKGKRYALPNARVMIHQPLGGFQGQATEIDIHAREILKIRERLNEIMAKHTGQPIEKISHDTERDYFMSAEEAKTYGLIDEVITRLTKPLKSVDAGDAGKDGAKSK